MATIAGQDLLVNDALYALQLDGQGGAKSLTAISKVTADQPAWLHLDYQCPDSANWINTTPLLPDIAKQALASECQRPRVTRLGEGILLTLRNINFSPLARPDQLVALSVYITDNLIISLQRDHAYGLDDTLQALEKGTGPYNSDDWLVMVCDALTDHLTDFIEDLHDRVIVLEDNLLDQQLPERGELPLLRKQLIVLRRYISPQRDILARLGNESYLWVAADKQHCLREVADRLNRLVDDLDACIARSTILADEVDNILSDSLNRRCYIMSLLALLFLPMTFLTGLLGVNLGGIPGSQSPYAFIIFSLILISMTTGVAWWLKRSKWM